MLFLFKVLGFRTGMKQLICHGKHQTRSGYISWVYFLISYILIIFTFTLNNKPLPCHPPLLNSCGHRVSDLITHFDSLALKLAISPLEPCNTGGLGIKTHSRDTWVTQLQCSGAGIFQVNSPLQHKPYIEVKHSSAKAFYKYYHSLWLL